MTNYISKQPDETIASPYVRFTRSDTEPNIAIARAGDLWYDETDNRLKYFDIGQVKWVSLADTDNSISLYDDALVGGVKEFTDEVKFAKGGEAKATATLTQRAESTEATAYFKFIDAAVTNGTITLISSSLVSKTYVGKADGSVVNGSLDTSTNYVRFNVGTDAAEAANNLKEAIDSANGHNAPETAATATFTFGDTEHDDYNDVSVVLSTFELDEEVDRLYRLKNDGTAQLNPDLIPASATFTFNHTATHNATLQLTDTEGTAVGYICKDSTETASTGDISKAYATIVCTALGTADSTLALISTDGHRVTYVVYGSGGFNGDLRPAAADSFTFTGAAPIDATVQLQSTDGTTRTYVSKATGSTGDPDRGDATRVTFLQGSDETDTATNLKAAIEHANGHAGKITVAQATNSLTLTQAAGGSSGNTAIDGSTDFEGVLNAALTSFEGGGVQILPGISTSAFATNIKAAIEHANGHAGKIDASIAADNVTITLFQTVAGPNGNTTSNPGPGLDGSSSNFLNSTSATDPYEFINGGLTVFQQGASASASATNLKTAIEGTSGHNGTLVVDVDSGAITLTQLATGSDGNTPLVDPWPFSYSTSPDPPAYFTGGGAYEFNTGSTDIETAANFAEAIKRNHNRELLVTASGTDGQVTLTQRMADAAGNTSISLPGTATLYPATASFTFDETGFNSVNDSTATLIGGGITKTYKIKNDGTATASSQEFNAGATASEAATNFKALVESRDGHGVKATAGFAFDPSDYASVDNAYIELTDYAGTTKRFIIKAGNDASTGTTEFNAGASASDTATNFKAVLESAAGFGTTPTVSATLLGSMVTLTQESAGSSGNTSITKSKGLRDWDDICSIVSKDAFINGDFNIQVEVSTSDGSVALTQSSAGAAGNTDITYSSWSSICDATPPNEFSGGGGEAAVTFTFGDTEFNGYNNEIIGLSSTNPFTSKTYKIKNDGTATASSQEFNAGATASEAATNLATLVNSSDGHNGTLKAIANGAKITIHQTVSGLAGETAVGRSSNWDALCDVGPTSTCLLKTLNDVCDVNIPGAFSGGGDVVYSGGITVDVNTSPGQVILTQSSTGSAGNTTITVSSTPDFDDSGVIEASPGMPSAFTEGSTLGGDLDNLTVILADADGNSHTLTYDDEIDPSTSTAIAIRNAATPMDAALSLSAAINLAQAAGSINMTSIDNLDGTLTLTMDTASSSGNGSKITGTAASSGKISISDFVDGLADPTPYAYFDQANERLGIKTTAPGSDLEVAGIAEISGTGNYLQFPDGTQLDSTSTEVVGIRVDNGSSALTTGVKGHRVLPYDCEIVEWTLTSTDTGNVDFEINWCTYANYPTTASAHAHHSYSPNLSSANKATSGTLTLSEWTTYQFSAGDILEFEIQSSTTPTVTNATLSVRIRRTV